MQRSVQSTLQMLDLIAHSREGLTMREIGPLCSEVSTATIYRILKTLNTQGFVVQDKDTKRYRVSLRLWELGAAALNQIRYRDAAAPFAMDLVMQLNMSVGLCFEEGEDVVFSEQFELHDERIISKPLVLRIPRSVAASGRAFLAHLKLSDDEIRAIARRIEPYTDRTIRDPDGLVRAIRAAERAGYAEAYGEYWGNSGAIAAAACDFAGRPRVAVSIGVRLSDYPDEQAFDELKARVWAPLIACVDRISAQLGYRTSPSLS